MPVRRFGQLPRLSALAAAFALAGCASAFDNLTTSQLRLDNPFKAETNRIAQPIRSARGPVAATDLVGPDGNCFEAAPAAPPVAEPAAPPPPPATAAAAAAAAAAPPPAAPASAPIERSNQALYFTAGPQAGGGTSASAAPPEARPSGRGIALDMSECDVVRVAGYTPNVQISANERGERAVTLTYMTGERPGIYHFVNGRLKSMERVAEPQVAAKPKGRTKSAKARR